MGSLSQIISFRWSMNKAFDCSNKLYIFDLLFFPWRFCGHVIIRSFLYTILFTGKCDFTTFKISENLAYREILKCYWFILSWSNMQRLRAETLPKKLSVVKLSDIPTWPEYFKQNSERVLGDCKGKSYNFSCETVYKIHYEPHWSVIFIWTVLNFRYFSPTSSAQRCLEQQNISSHRRYYEVESRRNCQCCKIDLARRRQYRRSDPWRCGQSVTWGMQEAWWL